MYFMLSSIWHYFEKSKEARWASTEETCDCLFETITQFNNVKLGVLMFVYIYPSENDQRASLITNLPTKTEVCP